MSRVLEELYYGNIRPDVRCYEKDPRFIELSRLKNINLDKLMESLNEPEKELLDKYEAAQSDMNDISRYAHFTYGFKLGTLLMAETFIGISEITGEETL